MMWMIYLVGTIDGVCVFFGVIAFIAMFLSAILLLIGFFYSSDREGTSFDFTVRKKFRKASYILFAIAFPMGLFTTLIPSSTTLAAMYLLPKLAQNQQLQQIPNKALMLLNDKLDEWIKQAQANGK